MRKSMVRRQQLKNNYVFKHKTGRGHYRADVFAIRCFDDRFRKVFEGFIKKLGIKYVDFESVAGGAKIFSTPEKPGDRDFMSRELEKSIRLHHTKKVMFFTHIDCGAYGSSRRFRNNVKAEELFHFQEHKKMRQVVLKRFPKMAIETYFIDWNGVIRTA